MARLKNGLSSLLLGLTLLNDVAGRRVNTTIHDTNTAHVTYGPQDDICVSKGNSEPLGACATWAKPWELGVYLNQGKLTTLHRSLDHKQPTVTVKFQGSAIWLYGPPRSQLPVIPVDYKICLYETHRASNATACYRVDIAEAYSAVEDYNAPVVIFAKGGLQDQEHQVVVSVGDPIGEVDRHWGIQFSHAVYTIDRPTPWPTNEDSWRFREVVMHSTHPLLSYWPKESISSSWRPWSTNPPGWLGKAYTAEDGSRVSWHELQSRGEPNQDEWGVDANVTAGAVAIYGVPKAHVTETDSLSDVCVRVNSGPCEIIDIKHAYLNTEHHHEAVLLWQNQALDPYKRTLISVRLIKTGNDELKVFPFKEIRYFERQEYSSPDPSVGRVKNVVVAHDDQPITFHPAPRCVKYSTWWCIEWFDPWARKEAKSSESVQTYRSTVSSYRKTENPSVTLKFQGSAVYVYGAPKSFVKDGFASQRICINDLCHIVDVEQAYLNAPEASSGQANARSLQPLGTSNATTLSPTHSEIEPVLIWSMTGLDDLVEHSLRLALAGLPSEDDAEMTIAKVVYTKVTYEPGQSRPDAPVPPPDRTYGGPVYPPHAINWASRPPLRPTSSHVFQFILWPVLGIWILISLYYRWAASRGHPTEDPERRPIRPITPPPPYVPRPIPPRDQNNIGPSPGPNAASPRPTYYASGTPNQPSRVRGTNNQRLNQAGNKYASTIDSRS